MRDSFSSCNKNADRVSLVQIGPQVKGKVRKWLWLRTNRNLKIDHLFGKRGHLVVEAEPVLADTLGRKDKVALALFGAV